MKLTIEIERQKDEGNSSIYSFLTYVDGKEVGVGRCEIDNQLIARSPPPKHYFIGDELGAYAHGAVVMALNEIGRPLTLEKE